MCLFCKIINQEIPSHKIYENDHVFAFLDIFPLSKGHTLVIPKSHTTHVLEATQDDIMHCFNAIKLITQHYDQSLQATGYNIVSNVHASAGQSVHHTHFHIIPRYNLNDTLFASFKEVKSPLDLPHLCETIKLV